MKIRYKKEGLKMAEITCPVCGQYIDANEIRNDTIDEIYDILYKEYYNGFRGRPESKQKQLDFIINGFFAKLKEMKND